MKKVIFLLYLLLSNSNLLLAQETTLNAVTNMYRIGDSIHYELIATRVAQAKLESEKTWDFSDSKYIGEEYDVHFIGKDSTNVRMIAPNAILHFVQENDELGLARLQMPLIDLNFGHSFSYLKYPFTVGDSLLCIYSGNG